MAVEYEGSAMPHVADMDQTKAKLAKVTIIKLIKAYWLHLSS